MEVAEKNPVILSRCKKSCNDKHLKRIQVKNHDGTFFQCAYCNRIYIVVPHIEIYEQGDVFAMVFKCIDKTFRSEEADEKVHIFLREHDEPTVPNRL